MPEIKRTFTAGKMNKDLDERLVRNGEYRHALNIQVRTSDGDDIGAVQNIVGSTNLAQAYEAYVPWGAKKTKFVGSVADEKNNKAYFFAAAPLLEDGFDGIPYGSISSIIHYVDSIIEVDADALVGTPIFVDKFGVVGNWSNIMGNVTAWDLYEDLESGTFSKLEVSDGSMYRVGMIIYLYNNNGNNLLFNSDGGYGVEILDIQDNTLILATEQDASIWQEWQNGNLDSESAFKFIYPERVLEFDWNKLISSINIVDNLLFWTDGINEPKKINIDRCKKGTIIPKVAPGEDISIVQTAESYLENPKHTKLYLSNTTTDALPEFVIASDLEWSLKTSDIKKEHITVIRKAPISPPTLFMRDTDRDTDVDFMLSGYSFLQDNQVPVASDIKIIDNQVFDSVDIRVNDVLRFVNADTIIDPVVITSRILEIDGTEVKLQIMFAGEDLYTQNPTNWEVNLEQEKPLFETKFGRVGYRYQYDDNEYSSFSPWSELAFLPSDFEYTPSKGYNEGMSNKIRQLIIRDFIPDDSIRPSDVKKIDILWKTTDDQNVYIIKSITRARDREWDIQEDETRGSLNITSEMIHRVLSNEQILRSWDNVPKTALAQEITASRLVYGNYTQGYDIDRIVGLEQTIVSEDVNYPNPKKSVKSIRSYKWGVVFGDKYGRETPVIAQGYGTDNNETATGDISVDKSLAHLSNRFRLKQDWDTEPETWMEYAKYYVKETSNEYYSLVLDRWYDADDGCIWLAFPSVDRNKIDEETYLILKNEHGNQNPVIERARYKVIAIENEAPDYIKTDYRSFELVEIDDKGVYDYNGEHGDGSATSDGSPINLFGKTKIRTDQSFWSFGTDNPEIEQEHFKGTAKVRIVARLATDSTIYYKSPWKTVSRIKSTGNRRGCDIKDTWTETDVNAVGPISLLTTITDANVDDIDNSSKINYYMEFRDEVVENKPQFDGRFFVKVEKDDILKEKVLHGNNTDYEILETYEVGYIAANKNNPAIDGGTYAGAAFQTLGGWESSTIENTTIVESFLYSPWEEDGVDILIENKTISSFGPGDSNATENFWQDWYTNSQRKTKIFIDDAPAWKGWGTTQELDGNGSINETQVAPILAPDISIVPISYNYNGDNYIGAEFDNIPSTYYTPDQLEEAGNTIENWKPFGFSKGNASSGTMNQITFSAVGFKEGFGPAEPGNEGSFKQKMQVSGTTFRFADDSTLPKPVYKTIGIDADDTISHGGVGHDDNVTGNISIDSKNYDGDDEPSNRHSIVIRFVKLDPEDGSEMYEGGKPIGMDTQFWDPRGTVQHNGIADNNGNGGSFTIEIVQQVNSDELLSDSIETDNACWETEPKKDIDIDIYYEASGAIPVNLKEDNINVFTGANIKDNLASSFAVLTRKLNGSVVEDVNIDNTAWAYETVGKDSVNIKYLDNVDGETVTSDLVTVVNNSTAIGVAIDDLITFTHKNSLVTQSKVLDHLKAVDLTDNGSNDTTVPSDRIAVSNLSYTIGDTLIGPYYISLGTPSVGDQVTGDGIDAGTFVVAVNSVSFPDGGLGNQITLNKAVISTQTNSILTFINVTGWFRIDSEVWKYPVELAWFNCYSFGNAVESDRIRDDFNAPQIDNGVKASSTFLDYGEETRSSGLIYSSGLYNDISNVNGLNEFSMAQKITKNLNPMYGSIQALKTRDSDIVTFCEDKVLKVLTNKDALFNADGNTNITSTDKVLGTAMPFAGDYGISKNPESLAWDQYRLYFTDKQRGAVLRLSMDGLTPISNVGMKSYFRGNLRNCTNLVGTFDTVSGEYNIKLGKRRGSGEDPVTISFNEGAKGWVSFKSFIHDCGESVNGRYMTAGTYPHALTNRIYLHHSGDMNEFYGQQFNSEIQVIFNDLPDVIKSFKTINYEGTQAKVKKHRDSIGGTLSNTVDASGVLINEITTQYTDAAGNVITDLTDGSYYNLFDERGWYVDEITTDLQKGRIPEFINKENKWFNNIIGIATENSMLDTSEFSVQGIGFPLFVGTTPETGGTTTNNETQTDAEIIIDPEIDYTVTDLQYTIYFQTEFTDEETGVVTGFYAMMIDSINGQTQSMILNNEYSYFISSDDSLSVPSSLGEMGSGIAWILSGTYTVTVTPVNNPSNVYTFIFTIDPNETYPQI